MTDLRTKQISAGLVIAALLALIVACLCTGCWQASYADRIRCPTCGEWAYCVSVQSFAKERVEKKGEFMPTAKRYEDNRHFAVYGFYDSPHHATHSAWIVKEVGPLPRIAEAQP